MSADIGTSEPAARTTTVASPVLETRQLTKHFLVGGPSLRRTQPNSPDIPSMR